MRNKIYFLLGVLCLTILSSCKNQHRLVPGEDYAIADMVQTIPIGNIQKDSAWHIWCGSMVKGYDGKYHLYYSRWPRPATTHVAWISHSEVAYAVAENPEGPFKFVNVALPQTDSLAWDGATTHNPYIIMKDGKYYLYYVGTQGKPLSAEETISGYGTEWWTRRNTQRIGVAIADSPAGPWRRLNEPVLANNSKDSTAFDALCVANPAICVGRNGKIVMLYKAVCRNEKLRGGAVRFSVAFADSPEGPFVKTNKQIFLPEDPKSSMVAEDPCIWYDDYTDCYYAIVRDVVGQFAGKESGGLALLTSKDAIDWEAPKCPKVLPKILEFSDGSTYDAKVIGGVERPFLYRDEDGNPQLLFGAFSIHKGKVRRDHSFNGRIPLKLTDEIMKTKE